jgi:hypothetical protein
MVADAEGATKVIQARVEGAASLEDARKAAREIIRSVGVKTAIYGQDANWGRVLSAVGNSGAAVVEEKVSLYFQSPDGKEICVFCGALCRTTGGGEGLPDARRGAYTCDMGPVRARHDRLGPDPTEEFVWLNSGTRCREATGRRANNTSQRKIGGPTLGRRHDPGRLVSCSAGRAVCRRPWRGRSQRVAWRMMCPCASSAD